jgi:hypothetical protein
MAAGAGIEAACLVTLAEAERLRRTAVADTAGAAEADVRPLAAPTVVTDEFVEETQKCRSDSSGVFVLLRNL